MIIKKLILSLGMGLIFNFPVCALTVILLGLFTRFEPIIYVGIVCWIILSYMAYKTYSEVKNDNS